LKALGVSIAMDDFGTGYSSLGYLWQFGFDKLKIDRSFVTGLDKDEHKARQILDTIVVLAHQLGMKVTAEGIENDRQAAILSALGCDQFQGYLFGRPAPASDLSAIFARCLVKHVQLDEAETRRDDRTSAAG
jgi:EAL domain-containing protein (putative c-di-GMP-specific phosphodiesterase class I)